MEQKKKRILIVEDERDISEILRYNVIKQGYEAEVANDGEKGLALALSGTFDLILLDVMLPKVDGFEICRRVRSRLETPIIMLTAREEENDKILGLDLGADDYMTKPFSLGELTSRIRANIRRFSGETLVKQQKEENEGIIKLDELEIDTNTYSVKKNGEEISLSKQQYELLCFLAKNRGKKFRQDALLEAVWGYDDYYGDVRTVDVTVARLRKQIEDNPSEPKFIKNKRGMGYYID